MPPDLNQARVNKCLIALVNRKIVFKENSTVCIIFVALKALSLSLMFLRGLSCITGRAYLEVLFFEDRIMHLRCKFENVCTHFIFSTLILTAATNCAHLLSYSPLAVSALINYPSTLWCVTWCTCCSGGVQFCKQ